MATKKENAVKTANEVINNAEKQVTNKPQSLDNNRRPIPMVKLSFAKLEGKALITAKSEHKKACNASLAEFASALDGAFSQVIKSSDRKARNVANAVNSTYGKCVLTFVAACFPYQTAEGLLCRKVKTDDGAKVWGEKPLTAAAARGIIRDCLKHYIDTLGKPAVTIVTIGAMVEA